ncbi:hypothetical protein AB3662_39425 [Sorangium cellulosum]|uniref:hypothetical protein n=1 Tax=Sorangium cellulosum TaxID=56 RepID=UPI003D9AB40E
MRGGEPREGGALEGRGARGRPALRRRVGLRRARERDAGGRRPAHRLGEDERPERRRHGRPRGEVERGLRGRGGGGAVRGGEAPRRLGAGGGAERAGASGLALRRAVEQRGAVALRRDELGDAGALPVAAGGDGDLALDDVDGRRARVNGQRHPDPARLAPARGVREPRPGAPGHLPDDGAAGADHDARGPVGARPEGDPQHVGAGRAEAEPRPGPERSPGRGALDGREVGALAAAAHLDRARGEIRLDERPEEQRLLEVARGEPCGRGGLEARGGRRGGSARAAWSRGRARGDRPRRRASGARRRQRGARGVDPPEQRARLGRRGGRRGRAAAEPRRHVLVEAVPGERRALPRGDPHGDRRALGAARSSRAHGDEARAGPGRHRDVARAPLERRQRHPGDHVGRVADAGAEADARDLAAHLQPIAGLHRHEQELLRGECDGPGRVGCDGRGARARRPARRRRALRRAVAPRDHPRAVGGHPGEGLCGAGLARARQARGHAERERERRAEQRAAGSGRGEGVDIHGDYPSPMAILRPLRRELSGYPISGSERKRAIGDGAPRPSRGQGAPQPL